MVSFFFYLLSTGNLQTKETHAQEILKTKKQKNSNYRLFFFHFCSGLEFPFRHVISNHSSKITALKFLTSITPGPQYNAFIVY